MVVTFFRNSAPILASLTFLFVIAYARAQESTGSDVLAIYCSLNSVIYIWGPIVASLLAWNLLALPRRT